jgi:anti-anti-sigma regulatory factor
MSITERTTATDEDADPMGMRVGDGADDPVTGPMPAVDFHDGRLRIHLDKDVTIITLDGGLDGEFAGQVVPTITRSMADASAVVLDVDQVTLLDQDGFEILARALNRAIEGRPCCIVASRLSGRMVLERWGVTRRHAVFTSVADALQARAFEANGYGEGWRPTD